MKICISSTMDKEGAIADKRFGRCPYYAIYDQATKDYHFIENEGLAEAHGAGLKAAQTMVDQGVQVVITGNVGPNALRVLDAGHIKTFAMKGNKVEDQIKYYQAGELEEITTPGAPHGGKGRNGFGHQR